MTRESKARAPRRGALLALVVGGIALILVAAGWFKYFAPSLLHPSFDRQLAHILTKAPSEELFILEWREGPDSKGNLARRVNWLDAYWMEGGELLHVTRHPFEQAQNGPKSYDVAGYQNHSLTPARIQEFKEFIDSAPSCEDQRDYGFTRMVLLPDGTPLFSTGCTGYNVNKLQGTSLFTVDGRQFNSGASRWSERLIALTALAPHMEMDIARLQIMSNANRSVLAESCISDGQDLRHDCRAALHIAEGFMLWPTIEINSGADEVSPLAWPENVSRRVPENVGSAYISPPMLTAEKLRILENQLEVADIRPTLTVSIFIMQKDQDSFAAVVYDSTDGSVEFLDENGNPI